MTTTSDGLTDFRPRPGGTSEEDSGKGVSQPLLSEQVFALELLADPGSAERWLTKTDEVDLPSRLLQWAKSVAAGTPRTEAPYWYDASPAYTRWLDSRDIDTLTLARIGEVADDAGQEPAGPQEDDLRGRIERLESTLRETVSLVASLAAVVPVTPGLYGRLQRQGESLARALDFDG
jgi:hypothetical protein